MQSTRALWMAAFWHAYAVTSHPSLRSTQSYFILSVWSDKTKLGTENEAKKRQKSLIVRFCFRHVIFLSHLVSPYHFGFRMLSVSHFCWMHGCRLRRRRRQCLRCCCSRRRHTLRFMPFSLRDLPFIVIIRQEWVTMCAYASERGASA